MTKKIEEILIIGYDFEAGAEANTDIDMLLGNSTLLFEERSIRCDEVGCYDSPDYCNNQELTMQELQRLGIKPILTPAIQYSKKKTHKRCQSIDHGYTAHFTIGDEKYATRPCESEEEALSCVLWYALAYFY